MNPAHGDDIANKLANLNSVILGVCNYDFLISSDTKSSWFIKLVWALSKLTKFVPEIKNGFYEI